MGNPGKNNVFVNSRAGGPAEQSRTKQASIKHENPEYFKRQSDRKMTDGGPGSGPQEGSSSGDKSSSTASFRERLNKGANMAARKEPSFQNTLKNYSNATESRAKKDNIPARKDVPIQRDFNHSQPNIGNDPGRGTGQVGRDSAPSAMKQFSKGTMY